MLVLNPGAIHPLHLSTMAIDRGPIARIIKLQRVNQSQPVPHGQGWVGVGAYSRLAKNTAFTRGELK